jgi:LmbE family N-acetylglucosaminyl deacetylase
MLKAALREGGPLSLLCLGAHADDIEIGCGATVLRTLAERPGCAVRWLVFSSDAERAAEARRSAAAFLEGAARSRVEILDVRESYFPYVGAELKDAFERLKADAAPDLVFAPRLADRHQDHRVVAELTWNTFRDHLVLEYEIPKYEGDLASPNLFVDVPETVARLKVDLILRHFPSQSARTWFRRETLEAVMRLRGVECNAAQGWAEAFHCRKLLM